MKTSATIERATAEESEASVAQREGDRAKSGLSSRSARRSRLFTALIVAVGVGIMSYPSIASWTNQVVQSDLVGSYQTEVDTFSEAKRLQDLQDASQYNDDLQAGTAYDPYADGIEEINPEQFRRYLGLLEGVPSGIMARVRIPNIGVDLPIYHGTDDVTLRKGVGHLYGTALPVGGVGTHSVLTAHSGLADAKMFTDLNKVKIGDLFQIETYGEKFTYKVNEINTILPDETAPLAADPSRDLVSLVTCTPVTVNTHRLVVTGERVENPAEPSPEMPAQDLPGFPWWAVIDGTVLVGCIVYVLAGTPQKRRAAQHARR